MRCQSKLRILSVLGLVFLFAGAAFAAGPVASLVPATQNLSTPVTATFNPSPIVLVYDSANNLLTGISVTFTTPSSGPSGTFSNGTHAITVVSSNGQAGAVLNANAQPGTYTVNAAALGANFQIVNASITVTNLGPTRLIPNSSQHIIQVGTNTHFFMDAYVEDQAGNFLPGYVVTFAVSPSGPSGLFDANHSTSYSVATDSSGLTPNVNFTPNNVVGPFTVDVSLLTPAGTILSATIVLANIGPPAFVTPVPGTTPQTRISGFGFLPLSVTVTDSANQPVAGATVVYQVIPAAAGFAVPANLNPAVTDPNGIASVNVGAGATLGSYQVTASSGQSTTAIFNLTNTAFPTSITPLPGTTPQSAPIGTAFHPLGVKLRDAANNPLSGYTVFFNAPNGMATATSGGQFGVQVLTDSNGNASAPFQANSVTGSYTVTAASSINGVETSFALTNTAAVIAPAVTQNPANAAVNAGATAQFTATASGSPTPTIQWQQSTDGGVTFSDLTGTTSSPLSFPASTAQNGYRFRAVFSNGSGTATTTAAILTVNSAPAVTQNPANATVNAGATAQLTAAASGVPTPAVQWQQSSDGGATFTNVAGATSGTLSFTTTLSQNGYQYRAIFSNSAGTVTTTAATLTVQNGPVLTQNPANVTVNAGATAQFTATASGNPTPTVQWQQSTNGGAAFSNIAGATSTNLSFTAIAAQDAYQFRAVFSNTGGTATSTAATLTVHYAPAITQNPANATVTAGATAQFTVAASGNPTPTVQWQQSTDSGATFTNLAGATSTTLSFTVASSQNGYRFRAVFLNSVGPATTTAATLTVQVGCDLNGDGHTNGADIQLIIDQALGKVRAVNDLSHDGTVNVIDVQIGLGCSINNGTLPASSARPLPLPNSRNANFDPAPHNPFP